MRVFVVGTEHSIQARMPASDSSLCDEFLAYVLNQSAQHSVKAIAEEWSGESADARQATSTIAAEAADALHLSYDSSDPDFATRNSLEIEDRAGVRLELARRRISEIEADERIAVSHERRESHWLQRLLQLHCDPILFVCGAEHVRSFARLLATHGHEAEVLFEDWPGLR